MINLIRAVLTCAATSVVTLLASQSRIDARPAFYVDGQLVCSGNAVLYLDYLDLSLYSLSGDVRYQVYALDEFNDLDRLGSRATLYGAGYVRNGLAEVFGLHPGQYVFVVSALNESCSSFVTPFTISTHEVSEPIISPTMSDDCRVASLELVEWDYISNFGVAWDYPSAYSASVSHYGFKIADSRGFLAPGDYRVQIIYTLSSTGCKINRFATFTVPCCDDATTPTVVDVTHPSECGAADGSFRVLGFTRGGDGNFDTELDGAVDMLGNVYYPTEYGVFENLPVGTYAVEGWADECELAERYTITLGESAGFETYETSTTPTCTGLTVGSVRIELTGPAGATHASPLPLDIVEDGAPDDPFSDYTITGDNLPAGEHCLTLLVDGRDCATEVCFTIREFADDGNANVRAQTMPTCGDADNGSVSLTVPLPEGSYEVVWSDGRTGAERSRLATGEYCYTLTTLCGHVYEGCATVLENANEWAYEFVPEPPCGETYDEPGGYDLSAHRLVTTAGPEPSFVGNEATGQAYDLIYSGTPLIDVTHPYYSNWQRNCTRRIRNRIPVSWATFDFEEPCGDDEGRVSLRLYSPTSNSVTATWNGQPHPIENDGAGVYTLARGALRPGLYTIALSVDGCQVEFEASLRERGGVDRTFVGYDAETHLCKYDQSCHGDPISQPAYEFAQRGDPESIREPWIGGCSIDLFCPGVETPIDRSTTPSKTVSKIVYQILYAQAEAAGAPFLMPRSNIEGKYFTRRNLCARVRYCPLTMRPRSYNPLQPGDGSNTYYDPASGCIVSSCGVGTRRICDLSTFLPPSTVVDPDLIIQQIELAHCNQRSLPIPSLLRWHEDLMRLPAYASSTLAEEVARLTREYREVLPPEAYCARVYFCDGNFAHIGTDPLDPYGYCGENVPSSSAPCLSSICSSCFETEGDCATVTTRCPVVPNPCLSCATTATELWVTSTCYPGDEFFSLTEGPSPQWRQTIVADNVLAEHRAAGWVSVCDEDGAPQRPVSLVESPYRRAVDFSAYGARVAYDAYEGLAYLDLALGDQAYSVAVQQLDSGSVELESYSTETRHYRALHSDRAINILATASTPEHIVLALRTPGELMLGQEELGTGTQVLVLARVSGELLTVSPLPGVTGPIAALPTSDGKVAVTATTGDDDGAVVLLTTTPGGSMVPSAAGSLPAGTAVLDMSGQTVTSTRTEKTSWFGRAITTQVTGGGDDDASEQVHRLVASPTFVHHEFLREGRPFALLHGATAFVIGGDSLRVSRDSVYLLDLLRANAARPRAIGAISPGSRLTGVYRTTIGGNLSCQVRIPHADTVPGAARWSFCGLSGTNFTEFAQTVTLEIPLPQNPATVDGRRSEERAVADAVADAPPGLRLVPNPVNDVLTVERLSATEPGGSVVQLLDASGALVRSIAFPTDRARLRIDVARLPEGVYSLALATSGGAVTYRERFVVVR